MAEQSQTTRAYRFGGRFEASGVTRQLLVDGTPAALGARAFDVLLALVDRRDRVVTKDELLEIVWPGVVVEENNLQVQISTLRKLLGTAAIATIPGRGYRFALELDDTTASPTKPASIVVLPFVNVGGDRENDYFADGLSEELLNVLSKIPGLRVTSRTSAFSFKGKSIELPTIARKLAVAHVLEGSVRISGNRVRVTAQLVEAETDSQVWSETYDRELDVIFAVQEDIAQSVVTELRGALFGVKPGALDIAAVKADIRVASKGRGEKADAYRLYLEGRYFEARFTQDSTRRAVKHYQDALEIDRAYALAWAGLARALREQADHFEDIPDIPLRERVESARQAALQAIELEPELAEGHDALGKIQMFHDWDWDGAESSLRRAMELAPGDARIISSRAKLLGSRGQLQEALTLLRRAITLDPLNATIYTLLATWSLWAGSADDGEAFAAKAIELDPERSITHTVLSHAYLVQGRLAEALRVAKEESFEPYRHMRIAIVQHALGRHAESDAALRDLIAKSAAKAAFQIAEVYAYRSEADSAFEWLERAYAQRDPGLTMVAVVPLLKTIHEDPRWHPFLKRMRLVR